MHDARQSAQFTKTLEPFQPGYLDRRPKITQVFGMKLKNTISAWIKTLACFAFAFALVLSPPSASHAASGTHGDNHAVPQISDHGDLNHVHDADLSISKHVSHASTSNTGDKEQASAQCCSGVCFSAVLFENEHDLEVQVASDKYLALHAQTASVDPSGFLRPPQFLI